MNLRDFEEWLRLKGMSIATIANYTTQIRRAISRIGSPSPTQDQLDHYAAQMPTNQRGAFRAAWRHLVAFTVESDGDVKLENVSAGRLGRPSEAAGERPEDFALAYLSLAIPAARLADLRWWSDVDFLSPVDAVIWDPVDRACYHVHRRPLDVLLAWGHPDGGPYGGVVPAAPCARTFMNSGEIEERAKAARKHTGPVDSVSDFIRRLSAPRREAWDPRTAPRPKVDPRAWKP
jgi:hypothetical protein